MKKFNKWLTSSIVLTTLSTNVIAHAGHDHSHWTSPLAHSIFGLSILAVVGIAVWKIKTRSKNSEKGEN